MPQRFTTEYWTQTAGDLSTRRTAIPTPRYTSYKTDNLAKTIIIDPTRQFQLWEGAGAAITDSSAYLFMTAMNAEQRHSILQEMFDPGQGGFSSVRISMGSCDFSSQKYYTYDDLPEGVVSDASLQYFSIGEGEPGTADATRDMKYVVPVLQEILAINPAVKVMASPWSAPAWMKTSGRIDGAGKLRLGEYVGNGYRYQDTIDYVYAQYFVKFIEAYEQLGIPITSVTMQNEPSNNCPWPITFWKPEELTQWGTQYLRPALDRTYPDVEIYFGDDSLRFYQRPVREYMSDQEAMSFAGAALHTYSGLPHWIHNATRQFAHWKSAMTERRCLLDDSVEEASHVMFGEIGTWLVRNGVGLINLWNMALDERGWPSWAGTSGRRGVITVDSATGKIKRNLEYYMIRNFGQDVLPGSRRIASSNYTPDGRNGSLGSVAFLAPNGDIAGFVYNPTGKTITAAISIGGNGNTWQYVDVPAWGTVSFHKSMSNQVNTTEAGGDDEFEIFMTPHPADDHDETAFE